MSVFYNMPALTDDFSILMNMWTFYNLKKGK